MKNSLLVYAAVILLFVSGCGINQQAQQIKALEKCTYRITSADQISVAGTDIKSLISDQNINLGSLPGLALGLLRRDIPLRARLNLEISNPTNNQASINEFEYKILINKQEIATGFVNQSVNVAAGSKTIAPVDMTANIYPFISNGQVMEDISKFLKARNGGPEQKGIVTLKIRPSIKVGGALVKYPGFITIDKEISSKILL